MTFEEAFNYMKSQRNIQYISEGPSSGVFHIVGVFSDKTVTLQNIMNERDTEINVPIIHLEPTREYVVVMSGNSGSKAIRYTDLESAKDMFHNSKDIAYLAEILEEK